MNKRLVPITEILLKENKYVTTDYIANSLNVSNKTIRNDVVELEVIIKDFNLNLDKKTGSGMAIRGEENLKLSLLSNLKLRCNSIIAYSPEDRKIFILKKLLTTDSNVSIRDFSSSLHVSRATVHKDLALAEEWLSSYHISIFRNPGNGLKIIAKEKNIRKALGDLIFCDREYRDAKDLLNSNHSYLSNLPSFKSFEDILNIDFSDLYEILFSIDELNFDKCSDESLISLLIHISIAINRISKNKYVGISEKSKNSLMSKAGYGYVKVLSEKISSKYNISIPDTEIAYFFLLILGLNLYSENRLDTNNCIEDTNASDYTIIAVDIINKWEITLNIPLSEDSKLLSSLVLHLNPLIHRLRYSLPISNPILSEIKSTYPNTYTVATSASDVIKCHTGYDIPEAEIGYLAVHLVSAIDRNKKPLRTLLVCHSSIGVSELLYTKIKKECPNIDIASYISLSSVVDYDLTSIDLVISTAPINIKLDCEIISVNTLLRKEDISRLNSLVKKLYTKKNELITSLEL